jgi:phosphoribosylformylglycinamidine synthase I
MIWHRDTDLPKLDLIVVPGGFSYGDYLRSGAMAAHSPIMAAVKAQAAKGVRVLGICNGFQVLTEAGLLPGVLMRNRNLSFICRDVLLRVETSNSDFTAGYNAGQVVRIPVAHHDGCYFAEEAVLNRLEDEDRVAFRYCDAEGAADAAANPAADAAHADAGDVQLAARGRLAVEAQHMAWHHLECGRRDGRALEKGPPRLIAQRFLHDRFSSRFMTLTSV